MYFYLDYVVCIFESPNFSQIPRLSGYRVATERLSNIKLLQTHVF